MDRKIFYKSFTFLFLCFCSCETENSIFDSLQSSKDYFIKFYGSEKAEEGKFIFEIDSNYYLLGLQKDDISDERGKVIFIKTDTHGNVLLEKTIATQNNVSINHAIIKDKNILFCGTEISSANTIHSYLKQIDLNGDEKSTAKLRSSTKNQYAHYIVDQNDKGVLLIGTSDFPIQEEIVQNTNSLNMFIVNIKNNQLGTPVVLGLAEKNDYGVSGFLDGGNILLAGAVIGNQNTHRARASMSDITASNLEVPIWDRTYRLNTNSEISYLNKVIKQGDAFVGIGAVQTAKAVQTLFIRSAISGGGQLFADSVGEEEFTYIPQNIELVSQNEFIVTGWHTKQKEITSLTATRGRVNFAKTTDTYIYLAKLNSVGQEMWIRSFGSQGVNIGNHAIQTSKGDYLICGTAQSGGNNLIVLIKTDQNGIIRK